MNIVENTNINNFENIINKKSEYESDCLEFFLCINSFMENEKISPFYLISNQGRIYDIYTEKFIPINNDGTVELICLPYYYGDICKKKIFSIDNLMMGIFKATNHIMKFYKQFDYKIIHKDNNSDNHNLSNLYCKIVNPYCIK